MFDRSWTFGIATTAGPDAQAQTLSLPDEHGPLYLEAWISNFGSSNVHVFDGDLSIGDCQERMERGFVDCLLTVTGAGPVRRRLPDDVVQITVFFEAQNTSGQFQLCTVRVHDE